MAELFLVRHGQASFASDNYDQLSALGRQQALWLGDYFRERELQFDALLMGTQQRHAETASAVLEAMGRDPGIQLHPGLNEYDFDALFAALGTEHRHLLRSRRDGARAFYRSLRQVLQLWQGGHLSGALPETWGAFADRVGAALRAVQQSGAKRVLAISSGGPIATAVAMVLGAKPANGVDLNLQMYNSGITRFYFNANTLQLAGFNYIPHLDRPDRLNAISYG